MVATSDAKPMSKVEAARAAERSRPSIAQRIAEGKALREETPRSSHAAWSPSGDRTDPIEILRAQDRTRLQELLPIRYGRMMVSPFTFLRGSAAVMAHDLADTPSSGLIVQACGDAHLSNFGGYSSPERNLVFDLNDFDETLPAPWEWDVKRLIASIVVAGRSNGYRAADCADHAQTAVRAYREWMAQFAQMTNLAVWYTRVSAADIANRLTGAVKKEFERGAMRASHRDHLDVLAKKTTTTDGDFRIVDEPPLITHHSDELLGARLPTLGKTYRSSIRDDLSALLQRYEFVDFAQKVVGVGSVGTRCYITLMRGNSDQDPLFLQIKEASASVLEPYAGKSKYRNHGERIVHGQQYTQAASDIFLGWGRVEGIDFYARQLRDMKVSVEVSLLTRKRMNLYAELCGGILARAHARSGDAARIAGYLGKGDAFDKAVVAFGVAYADQTERDHAALLAAIKSGKIAVETGL
jgi:uncharacterized protein (DUF2252 family)